MRYVLRPDQEEVLQKVKALFVQGARRVILFLPTGAGKTVIASHVVEGAVSKGNRVLFLAHRRELIFQSSEKLANLGVSHGIIMGSHPTSPSASVQVASVQTAVRRNLGNFQVVIVDECHHARSDSYQEILNRYPQSAILGLSATPYRLDGKGLGKIFQEIVPGLGTRDLINAGHLVPFRVFAPPTIDMRGAKIRGGDFAREEMSRCMGTKIYGDILRHWQNHGRGLPTVLFAASVQQSEELVAEFRGAGVAAAHIDASTLPAKRDEALKALASGNLELLSNVGILTEGWDCPPAACGIMARPTASLCLHVQMVGRMLRTFQGKTGAIILDHAGNHLRHGFVTDDREIDLDGLKKRSKKDGEVKVPSVRICPSCYACMPGATLVCPQCGHVFEATGREIRYNRASILQEIKPGPLKSWQRDMGREVYPDAPKKPRTKKDPATYYAEKLAIARERGYNLRWADHQFMATFGKWPSFGKGQIEEKSPKRSWAW